VLYLAAGVIGAPVFAGGAFGIARIFGPSGGYLLAFPIAAALVGWLTGLRKERLWTAFAMAVGLVVIFVLGTVHLFAFTMHDLGAAITSGFLLFTWWDLLKLGAATMIYAEIGKRWPRLPPR
jgi:biotin transport system substrate-specific component